MEAMETLRSEEWRGQETVPQRGSPWHSGVGKAMFRIRRYLLIAAGQSKHANKQNK